MSLNSYDHKHHMQNIIGSPVYGSNFVNRKANLDKALRYMKNGNSFLILGIRRTGKSSFLKQVAYLLKRQHIDNVCVELDCQQFDSILEFYKALYTELPKELKTKLRDHMMDGVKLPLKLVDFITDHIKAAELVGVKVELQDKVIAYSKPLESMISTFFKENKNVYLFLDEVPFFFENLHKEDRKIEQITQVLTSLRTWRDAGLPMAITGSLNLHQQLDSLGISRKLLAGLNTLELKSFTRNEAKEMLEGLLENENIDWWLPETTEAILDSLLDYVPYFINYVFNEIVVAKAATGIQVESTFHNEINAGLFRDFIYQFDERLKVFKGAELEKAMIILDAMAVNKKADLKLLQTTLNDQFQYDVLVKLIEFEFLEISGKQEYSFALNTIKDWWITKRGL